MRLLAPFQTGRDQGEIVVSFYESQKPQTTSDVVIECDREDLYNVFSRLQGVVSNSNMRLL